MQYNYYTECAIQVKSCLIVAYSGNAVASFYLLSDRARITNSPSCKTLWQISDVPNVVVFSFFVFLMHFL